MDGEERHLYRFKSFRLDVKERQLLKNKTPVILTPKAFDVLIVLIKRNGHLIEKDELLQIVWFDSFVEEANLARIIHTLRKALGEDAEHKFIETVAKKGYRFVAQVQVLENHSNGSFVERESENSNDSLLDSNGQTKELVESELAGETKVEEKKNLVTKIKHRRKFMALGFAAVLLCSIFVLTIFQFKDKAQFNRPFQKVDLSRLTTNGKVKLVALSPDGNLIAFVTPQKEGNSLSVQQVGAGNIINVVPPRNGEFVNVTFSADNKLIYYTFFSGGKTDVEFYSVPALGGVIQKVPNFVTSISPNGKQFVHPTSLNINGETGLAIESFAVGAERQLVTRHSPASFNIWGQVCSWSPDGEIIAAIGNNVDEQGNYSTLIGVNARDGKETPLTAKRWNNINNVEWLKDGKGVIVVGSEQLALLNQIWFVSFPEGEVRKLTSDLNDYSSLGISPDGKLIVSVQTTQTSSLWIGEVGQNSNSFRELISETGFLSPIDLTTDDHLVFRSNADGKSNLWMMRTDGSERRQLTANAQVDGGGICVTKDVKQVIFVSSLAGESGLWRVDIDGGNLRRLTNEKGEISPSCSPDDQFVICQKSLPSGKGKTLWKIPLNGSQQIQLLEDASLYYAIHPTISPDGKRIAFFYMTNEKWHIGIISINGGAIEQTFDVPSDVPDRIVRWAQNSKDLYYAANIGDIGNVWQLSPNGKTKQITNFDSKFLDDFILSPNGRKMAITRTTNLSDVIGIVNQP